MRSFDTSSCHARTLRCRATRCHPHPDESWLFSISNLAAGNLWVAIGESGSVVCYSAATGELPVGLLSALEHVRQVGCGGGGPCKASTHQMGSSRLA